MKEISLQISEKTHQQILQNCFIRIDRASYKGCTIDSVSFYKQFNTSQYLFEVFGEVDIVWLNEENYEFNRVSSISISMYDDAGEIFPDEKIYDTIEKNLEFSII